MTTITDSGNNLSFATGGTESLLPKAGLSLTKMFRPVAQNEAYQFPTYVGLLQFSKQNGESFNIDVQDTSYTTGSANTQADLNTAFTAIKAFLNVAYA